MIILILVIITLFIYMFINRNNIESFNSNINSYNNPYDKIDIIYYINLDHRNDRNEYFLNEMIKMDIPSDKIKRISGFKHNNGSIGCSTSHINILKEFINSPFNNCIIFEDDFEFTITKDEFKNQLSNLFDLNINFDVVCLSANVLSVNETDHNFLYKVINAQTTSGYLITKKFAINYLLENFIIGKYLLETYPNKEDIYSIDQYWKLLQPQNNWYLFNPKIGKQRESYSDILKNNVNYQV